MQFPKTQKDSKSLVIDDGLWLLSPVRYTGSCRDSELFPTETQEDKNAPRSASQRVFDAAPDRDGY